MQLEQNAIVFNLKFDVMKNILAAFTLMAINRIAIVLVMVMFLGAFTYRSSIKDESEKFSGLLMCRLAGIISR